MSKRTFLLGAGFSKAISGAPVMTEMWEEFEKAYEKEKDKNHSENRVTRFEELDSFIKYIEKQSKKKFKSFDPQKNDNYITSNIKEKFEYIVTLINFQLDTSPDLKFNEENADVEDYPLITLDHTRDQLKSFKKTISTYLKIVLSNYELSEKHKDFFEIINNEDEIITFNYDLLVEKALWNKEIWTPVNGYVGLNNFEDKIYKEKIQESNIKIHKMHGSLNFVPPKVLFKDDKVKIGLIDEENNWEFYFKGMEDMFDKHSLNKTSKEVDAFRGQYSLTWLLPSYIKPFYQANNIYNLIWKSAINVLSQAEELIIIGYSFRPEDFNAHLLLYSLNPDCKITLINPDDEVEKSLRDSLGVKIDTRYDYLKEYY